MNNLSMLIAMSLLLVILLVGCGSKSDIVDSNDTLNESNLEDVYYTMDDFKSIIIGESTFQDVYNIAPNEQMRATSYGGLYEYPMQSGGYILIKFYGSDLIVGAVEEVSNDDLANGTYRLIVNEKEITVTNHVRLNYEYHYAELPIIAILKELGANVEWQSETTANIALNGKGYFLDISKASLVNKGNDFNFLIIPPCSNHGTFYQVADKELIIDSDSARLILMEIGFTVNINFEDGIVNIRLLDI